MEPLILLLSRIEITCPIVKTLFANRFKSTWLDKEGVNSLSTLLINCRNKSLSERVSFLYHNS